MSAPLPFWHAILSSMNGLVRSSYTPLLHMLRCHVLSLNHGAFAVRLFGLYTITFVPGRILYLPLSMSSLKRLHAEILCRLNSTGPALFATPFLHCFAALHSSFSDTALSNPTSIFLHAAGPCRAAATAACNRPPKASCVMPFGSAF